MKIWANSMSFQTRTKVVNRPDYFKTYALNKKEK